MQLVQQGIFVFVFYVVAKSKIWTVKDLRKLKQNYGEMLKKKFGKIFCYFEEIREKN